MSKVTVELNENVAALLETLVKEYGSHGVVEAYVADDMDKGHSDDAHEVMLSLLDAAAIALQPRSC